MHDATVPRNDVVSRSLPPQLEGESALRAALVGVDCVGGVYRVACRCAHGPHPHFLVVVRGGSREGLRVARALNTLELEGLDYDLLRDARDVPAHAVPVAG